MRRPTLIDRLLVRHLLTHPKDSAYSAAKHMGLPTRTVQLAAKRIKERIGLEHDSRLKFLITNPIPHKRIELRHPNPNIWLRRPPADISISGEDAAAVLGWDIVPNRHMFYVNEKDLEIVIRDLLDNGGRLSGKEQANITLCVRDAWLIDEPAPLVERGQRLIDYTESKNLQLLNNLQEGMSD